MKEGGRVVIARVRRGDDDGSKNQRDGSSVRRAQTCSCVAGSDGGGRGHKLLSSGWTLRLEKTRKHPPPGSPEGMQVCPSQHPDLSPVRYSLGLWNLSCF